MRISDWSSDVCSSDLVGRGQFFQRPDQGFGDEAPAVAAEVATGVGPGVVVDRAGVRRGGMVRIAHLSIPFATAAAAVPTSMSGPAWQSARRTCRSEEHTSELQSLLRNSYAVVRLK